MSPSIDETAVRWAIRLDAKNMGVAERRDLDDWLARDPRHRGALLRARAGLVLIDEAGACDQLVAPRPWWHGWRGGGAALAVACLLALLVTPLVLRHERYRTAIGEMRRVTLADGSVTLVNTDSDVAIDYRRETREILLDRGEAWFKVAKNPARPFVVYADGVHVRATGTAFAVRRKQGVVTVVVTEGKVLAWSDAQPERVIPISAGNEASIATARDPDAPAVKRVGNDDPLAWQQGGLALNETSVAAAADELNRYNLRRLRVANPEIGAHLMTGYFQVDRPDQFAEAVAQITGAKISKNGNEIVIE